MRLFGRALETRENPVGPAFVHVGGGPRWSRKVDPKAIIEEGYQQNVMVYRAIREIVRSAADLSVELKNAAGDLIEAHPALDLLTQPTPMHSWDAWLDEMFTLYLIGGEMWCVAAGGARPAELWPLSYLNMEVIPGRGGIPLAYVHQMAGGAQRFAVDQMTGASEVFYAKMFNPGNYWRGQSPLVAAALAADTHNAGVKWNFSLLSNMARPSGLVKFPAGQDPSTETLNRLREWFKRSIQGAGNAGEIGMLTGGAEWQPMDNTPKDMDFVTTQKEMAKLVAAAYGVPLPLIDTDASTFNNMAAAKEQFFTDTVVPMFRSFLASFGGWLLPRYGDGLRFDVDLDDIPALEGSRQRAYDRVIKAYQAGLLTIAEARVAIGYDEPTPDQLAQLDPVGAAINGATAAASDGDEARSRNIRLAYGAVA